MMQLGMSLIKGDIQSLRVTWNRSNHSPNEFVIRLGLERIDVTRKDLLKLNKLLTKFLKEVDNNYIGYLREMK